MRFLYTVLFVGRQKQMCRISLPPRDCVLRTLSEGKNNEVSVFRRRRVASRAVKVVKAAAGCSRTRPLALVAPTSTRSLDREAEVLKMPSVSASGEHLSVREQVLGLLGVRDVGGVKNKREG